MQRMEKYSRRRYHKNDSAYLCTEMASQSESPYAKKIQLRMRNFWTVVGGALNGIMRRATV